MIREEQRGIDGLQPLNASPPTDGAGHAIIAAAARLSGPIEHVRYRRPSTKALIGLDIAALFVDLNGFTSLCTTEPPDQIFELVREFRRRITGCVVRHGGCLNRHFGDGGMASFGIPTSSGDDAARALRCAHDMLRQIRELDVKHRIKGRAPVSITIGLQWGPVLMGNVGTVQHPDIVPLGDVVNVASRLENLGHGLRATIVAGEELVEQVRRERGYNPPELEHFECLGPQPIRGRSAPVTVWTLPTCLVQGIAPRPQQRLRGRVARANASASVMTPTC
jgi:class 3 adenylate cyclase